MKSLNAFTPKAGASAKRAGSGGTIGGNPTDTAAIFTITPFKITQKSADFNHTGKRGTQENTGARHSFFLERK
jgi:hypothetical protein